MYDWEKNKELEDFIETAKLGQDLLKLALYIERFGVNAQGFEGNTPLHMACLYGHSMGVVKMLIDSGADPNIQNTHWRTALHMATVADHHDIALFLLQHGASIDVKDGEGCTPLFHIEEEDIHLYESYIKTTKNQFLTERSL